MPLNNNNPASHKLGPSVSRNEDKDMPSKKGSNSKRLSDEFIIRHLMEFYESTSSFNSYCTEHFICSKRVSLRRIAVAVGLFDHKADKASHSLVHKKLCDHLGLRKKVASDNLKEMQQDNKVLTEDEINLVVRSCEELSTMGIGIDEETCLLVVNSVLSERIESKYFKPVTRGVVSRLIKENSDLLKLTKGNSIDPKRVRQADADVRNALFVKLDNFVRLLHSQGKVPWKSFAEVPGDCMANMDKIATNAHDHRKKLIAARSRLGRLFQEVNSGDNKMPFHISICITTTPNGKLV